MLAEVHTERAIGSLTNPHRVMVVAVNPFFGVECWPDRLERFWDHLFEKASGADVMMGNFERLLMAVVPSLRKRNMVIDLAAWFPFKSPQGTPCASSSAIFFLGKPGRYQLHKGIADLHAKSRAGILWDRPKADAVAAGESRRRGRQTRRRVEDNSFQVFPAKDAGYDLKSFVHGSLEETLTPTMNPLAWKQATQVRKHHILMKMSETRLQPKDFLAMQGDGHKQYPLCCFCNSVTGARSAAALARRKTKRPPRKAKNAKWAWGSGVRRRKAKKVRGREGSGVRWAWG